MCMGRTFSLTFFLSHTHTCAHLQEQQAKVGAAQELARATASLAALGASPDAVMDAVRAFTATVGGSGPYRLADRVQRGWNGPTDTD